MIPPGFDLWDGEDFRHRRYGARFYRTAKPENKQRLKVTLIPLIVTRAGGDHRTF